MASHANDLVTQALSHDHGPHVVARLCGNLACDAPRDCDCRGDLTVLRDLDVLFGLVSLEALAPDRTENLLGIFNIERIRDYREALGGRLLCVSDPYQTNLSCGIEPYYGGALRGFGLIDANSRPVFEDELRAPMFPAKEDREKFANVARRWLAAGWTPDRPQASVPPPSRRPGWISGVTCSSEGAS